MKVTDHSTGAIESSHIASWALRGDIRTVDRRCPPECEVEASSIYRKEVEWCVRSDGNHCVGFRWEAQCR